MKRVKKGEIINFPNNSLKKQKTQTEGARPFQRGSVFYMLVFLTLITMTNTYLLRESQILDKSTQRNLASLSYDKNIEKKLEARLNSLSSRAANLAQLAQSPNSIEEMIYGEDLKGAYSVKYVQGKVLSLYSNSNDNLAQFTNLESFIEKNQKNWAVKFSSLSVEEKMGNKLVYALFDEKRLKTASVLVKLNSKGDLLSLEFDPVLNK